MKISYLIAVSLSFLPLIPSTTHYVASPVVEASSVQEKVATVTAYTSSVDETDEDPWTTASGTVPGPGTAACPGRYEFGTEVEIDGKIFVCEDRMNIRYRDLEHYDIWLTSKDEAVEWGRREVVIKIK